MKKGFTLIELIVVIAIIAVMIAIAVPNLLSARERARDASKKQELNEMKTAIRLFYNDFQYYPPSIAWGGAGKVNYIAGCGPNVVGTAPTTTCPCTSGGVSVDFATGPSCEAVYMKKFPSTFGSSIAYYPVSSPADDFCLKTTLENAADPDLLASQTRCGTTCTAAGAGCSSLDYCVCAD